MKILDTQNELSGDGLQVYTKAAFRNDYNKWRNVIIADLIASLSIYARFCADMENPWNSIGQLTGFTWLDMNCLGNLYQLSLLGLIKRAMQEQEFSGAANEEDIAGTLAARRMQGLSHSFVHNTALTFNMEVTALYWYKLAPSSRYAYHAVFHGFQLVIQGTKAVYNRNIDYTPKWKNWCMNSYTANMAMGGLVWAGIYTVIEAATGVPLYGDTFDPINKPSSAAFLWATGTVGLAVLTKGSEVTMWGVRKLADSISYCASGAMSWCKPTSPENNQTPLLSQQNGTGRYSCGQLLSRFGNWCCSPSSPTTEPPINDSSDTPAAVKQV